MFRKTQNQWFSWNQNVFLLWFSRFCLPGIEHHFSWFSESARYCLAQKTWFLECFMQLKTVLKQLISDILRLVVFVKTTLIFTFYVFEFTISRRHTITACKNEKTHCWEALRNTLKNTEFWRFCMTDVIFWNTVYYLLFLHKDSHKKSSKNSESCTRVHG